MSVRSTLSGHEVSNRWPRIEPFLRVDPNDWVDGAFHRWACLEGMRSAAERAAAYDEWADFYEWRLARQADELARDHRKRNLVEKWTDEMAYCARRCAAFARGEDPGEWVPLWERRPDLDASSRAIVAEIVTGLDARPQQAGAQAALRKAG